MKKQFWKLEHGLAKYHPPAGPIAIGHRRPADFRPFRKPFQALPPMLARREGWAASFGLLL
jgi:hypothetical protein